MILQDSAMLQRVATDMGVRLVLQRVAACCSLFAACCSVLPHIWAYVLAVCCSVLRRVPTDLDARPVLQCVAGCCCNVQFVSVCCNVLSPM